MLRVIRDIAIIAVLALGVAFVPGGGNVADALLTAILLGFLTAIAFAVHRLYRQSEFSWLALSDRWQMVVITALAAIVLMIAGTDELLGAGGLGILAWIGVIAGAVFALVRAWGEAHSY